MGQVVRAGGHRDLLGEAGAQGVGARDDHAVIHAQFQERVADRVDLGQEVLVGNRHLAVLVAALLGVGYLVLDLDGAGARLDHFLGQQVGRFLVAEAGIDVGNDGHHVGFEAVDGLHGGLLGHLVAGLAGGIEVAEQLVQLPGIGLAQEGVELFDQPGHGGLLVHGLVGQGAELAAQGCDHPAGEVQVALAGAAVVLLDGNQLLLADETVPAAQGLGVLRGVRVVLGHVLAHDLRGVLRDLDTGLEAVLELHAGGVFGVDRIPGVPAGIAQGGELVDEFLVSRHRLYLVRMC